MKVNFICFLLLSSLTGFSQSKSSWEKLQNAAHNIGYCLYNLNQNFCNAHLATQNRLIIETPEDSPEETYFVMKEKWAKERVITWEERINGWDSLPKINKDNLIVFFDVNQYALNEASKNLETPSSSFSFFILNLKDDLKFIKNKSYKNLAMNCSVGHKNQPNILWNIMWREFMTGRYALLKNKVEFNVTSNSKIRSRFRIFKRHFYRFKKQNLELD